MQLKSKVSICIQMRIQLTVYYLMMQKNGLKHLFHPFNTRAFFKFHFE